MIIFDNVWKKYHKHNIFHRSIREDIVNLFRKQVRLKDNEFWALRNISFEIKKGECVGLYGPNGAGKSTILKIIAKVTYPSRGKVIVNGSIAPLIEIGAGFHMDLTGKENIYVNGTILGMRIIEIRQRLPEIIEFSGLEEFMDMPVKKYSSGMYLRLGFSVAIHSDADIFLIDEILAVGDEPFQNKCLNKIRELKRQEKTIIFVTHNKELMEKVTDRVLFLRNGLLENKG